MADTLLSKNTSYTPLEEYLKEVIELFKEELIFKISKSTFDKVINNKRRVKIHSYVKRYSNFDYEFFDIIPDEKDKIEYNKIIWEIFCYELYFEGTGVIFGGFDSIHNNPSYFEINIHCNDNGRIIYDEIDFGVCCQEPSIKIFAMNEEAYTFITGVNYKFEEYLEDYVEETNELILENIKSRLTKENFDCVDEIVNICNTEITTQYSDLNQEIDDFRNNAIEFTSFNIEYLPRNLLCIFIDYLIQLTGLKQKISSDIESVGMDADIAVMTKIYGFKWFKYDDSRV